MISAILIIGNAGSGKSVILWYLSGLLDQDGVEVKYLSDRIGLEEAVERDTKRARPDKNGVRVGAHSKFISDGPPGFKKVHVLDGHLLNGVHKRMIDAIKKNTGKKRLLLLECAIGPDVNFGREKEQLLQSAKHIIGKLRSLRLTKRTFVIDVEAPFTVRETREIRRRDAMAAETFRAYFPDGGRVTRTDRKTLGKNYARFYNTDEDHEWCYSEIKYLYEQRIRPKIITKFSRKAF